MRPLIYVFLFVGTQAFAQKKIHTIEISDTITYATVDRVGELYIVTKEGQIQKFDTQGKLLSVYKNGPSPTLFEARDGSRLFAFFRKERVTQYLNPSFEIATSYLIDSAFIIEPWLACSSGDHNLWILDAADRTLKKIDPRNSILQVDVKLANNLSPDFSTIVSLREYQGFVFLHDKHAGIHIFNGMGKWLKTIPGSSIPYFNFIGEELYYGAKGKLIYLNLFTTETRETAIRQPFKFALITDERLFIIKDKSVDFFEFRP